MSLATLVDLLVPSLLIPAFTPPKIPEAARPN